MRISVCFYYTDTAPSELYTLSLHDALPICGIPRPRVAARRIGLSSLCARDPSRISPSPTAHDSCESNALENGGRYGTRTFPYQASPKSDASCRAAHYAVEVACHSKSGKGKLIF